MCTRPFHPGSTDGRGGPMSLSPGVALWVERYIGCWHKRDQLRLVGPIQLSDPTWMDDTAV